MLNLTRSHLAATKTVRPSPDLCENRAVIPRPILAILVFTLPLLVVAFGVLMGGATLAQATLDLAGAQVLRWMALSILMLGVVDLVLLVGVLGINALADPQAPSDRSDE